MTKDNNQGKQKPQSGQIKKVTVTNESIKRSKDTSGVERFRKGTAGDSTNSTGPRKK